MERFKRNQVEEAIAHVAEGAATLSPELRTRVKRLLETDRSLPPEAGAFKGVSALSAFFSEESPGKGREIWFSAYEAFAIAVGLLLMRHGWPQSFAVRVLRRARRKLENAFAVVNAHDPRWLFDQEEIRSKAQEGSLAFDNQDPILLSIVSAQGSTGKEAEEDEVICDVSHGPAEAFKFSAEHRAAGRMWTFFDIVRFAHEIDCALRQTKPQHRGRS